MASIDAVMSSGEGGSSRRRPSDDDDDPADRFDALDIREDSEGWNDAEDDAEELEVKCLLCEDVKPSVTAMVEHCKSEHDFDLVGVQKSHGR